MKLPTKGPRYLVGAAIIAGTFVLGDVLPLPASLGLVSGANAVSGQPVVPIGLMTPVSVAGVARRTARPCSAGDYFC